MRTKLMTAFVAVLSLFGMVYAAPVGAYDSNEQAEVISWYNGTDLNVDWNGVAYWANRFDGHNDVGCGSPNRASAAHDMKSFLASARSATYNSSNTPSNNFWKVYYAYRVVLGRYPDSGGQNYWISQLNGGTHWYTMVDSMTNSTEYLNTKINGGAWDFVPC